MSSTILVCLALCTVLSNVLTTDLSWSNNISAVVKRKKTCADVPSGLSGVYEIQPQFGFSDPFLVFCDQVYLGGGWTVIQNRFEGSVDFYRGWAEYENGFGDLQGEFWLGLRKIHELTGLRQHELHVILEDFEHVTVVAQYSHFLVGGLGEKYKLNNLGMYRGTAGDSLSNGVNQSFYTLDADNTHDCANRYKGGWWYNNCHQSNLNGLYLPGPREEFATMMCWKTFRGYNYGLKRSRMMIRPLRGV